MEETIIISFSGGLTSAYMTLKLMEKYKGRYKFVVIFANTGKENTKTLDFIKRCDDYYGFNTVWIEAVTNPVPGKGVSYKVVDYATASRNGEPFEESIKKHGISNRNAPQCTRELKTRAVNAYLRENGLRECKKAIGIRSDEADRINPNFKKERIIYPLISSRNWPSLGNIRKTDILEFWEGNVFTLGLLEEDGNCDACWKKSISKLVSIARRKPDTFNWWAEMEAKYNRYIPPGRRHKQKDGIFNFYRHNLGALDIIKLSTLPDDEIKKILKVDNLTEALNGCSESCEAF